MPAQRLFTPKVGMTSPEFVNLVLSFGYSNLRKGLCQHIWKVLTWGNCDHCSHYFIAVSITLLLRVNLVQRYHYSILRRVCVSISKCFLTWFNCSQYFIAQSITLLLRVCFKLAQCYQYSIQYSQGCVSVCLNTFWHGSNVITDPLNFIAAYITLLLRVCVDLVQCYQ